jgi:transcriptional regulator GlxA family with amidase domain
MEEIKKNIAKHHFRIGLLLVNGFALMSYSSIIEPLRAANLLEGYDYYKIMHLAANGKAAISSSGVVINSDKTFKDQVNYDLVLVIAGGDPASFDNRASIDWLRYLARNNVRLGGVSGGPVILAMAGLLRNRRMTVHWEHAEVLSETLPDLLLERSLYVIDRDRITCAGGIAPLDLMHALLSIQHGANFARKVSDWFMHTEIRPSSSAQRAGLTERYGVHHPALLSTIENMENNFADPLRLNQLASFVDLSPRQLNRLFNEKLGQSTMQFYRILRLQKAKNLIEQSSLNLTEIALATGFSSSAHFSTAFRAQFNESPINFRAQIIT